MQRVAWKVVAAAAAAVVVLGGCGGSKSFVGKDGKQHAIGAKVAVDFDDGKPSDGGTGKSGKVTVELQRISKGSANAVAAASGNSTKGATPYYLHFRVANTGGTDLAGTRLVDVNGLLDDGSAAQGASVPEDFAGCPARSAPSDFTSRSATYTTCRVALAPSGSKIVGGNYIPGDLDSTIVWK